MCHCLVVFADSTERVLGKRAAPRVGAQYLVWMKHQVSEEKLLAGEGSLPASHLGRLHIKVRSQDVNVGIQTEGSGCLSLSCLPHLKEEWGRNYEAFGSSTYCLFSVGFLHSSNGRAWDKAHRLRTRNMPRFTFPSAKGSALLT